MAWVSLIIRVAASVSTLFELRRVTIGQSSIAPDTKATTSRKMFSVMNVTSERPG
jgi:hypothetical protein